MTTKDATVITRLSADEREQLQAIADANDESLSQTVRRAIRAFLAVSAVLVTVLGLSACGAEDQPSAEPVATSVSIEDAQATVAAQQSQEMNAAARALAGECFSLTYEPTKDEFAGHEAALVADLTGGPGTVAAYQDFLAWLPAPSTGCEAADSQALATYRTNAQTYLDTIS